VADAMWEPAYLPLEPAPSERPAIRMSDAEARPRAG
jgi:hypothetical protein